MDPLLIAVVAIVVVVTVINYLKVKWRSEAIAKHFPNPPRVPILGITVMTESGRFDPIEIFNTMMSLPQKYGKNLITWGLFNHCELIVTDSKDVETIMAGKNTKKSRIYKFIQPWLGDGILVAFGDRWFNKRKIITPSFHFKILEQFIEVFNEQNKKLVQKLEKHVGGDECNIYEYLTAVALDNICETSMGVQINAQDNPNSEYIKAVKEMAEIFFRRIFSLLSRFPWIWALTPKAWRCAKVVNVLHKFTDTVINNRRSQLLNSGVQSTADSDNDIVEGRKQKFSLLDMLLQARVDGKPLSHSYIREEVDTFMFAGHDTTTSGMTFTMYHLAMNPEVQEKVFQELRSIKGDDSSTPCSYNELQEMKYLDKVFKETLRLHPSVPIIGRETMEPIQIQGVTIPANFHLTIPIYAIHRNPEVFPDPEKFDPERFSEEAERSWGPFDYIPFSAGIRNCIGQKYAMLEMKCVISTILRNFKVVATEKSRGMKFRSDMTLRPVNGLHVALERRLYE